MNIAQAVKLRSPDPKIQVGAVLVSLKDHRIISSGYNGLPSGCNENIDWKNRDYVHDVIIHAEMNCLLYAESKFSETILYSTLSPCKDCIKILAASNIKKIVYHQEYRDVSQVKQLCKLFNIEFKQYKD
jgi:dCMP deaminase